MKKNMFDEKSIRPENKRDYALKLMKQDLKKILKSDMVEIDCPVCSSKKNHLVFKKNKYDFVKCSECSMIFIKKRPNIKILDEFYNNSEGIKYWNSQVYPLVEKARIKSIYAPRAVYVKKIVDKYIKNPLNFLEIGAGCGDVCRIVESFKIFSKVEAVEFSIERCDIIRKKGIKYYNIPLEEFSSKTKYDIIAAFEIIEHLFEPKSTLLQIYRLLKKKGCVVVSTPNIEGFEMSVLGKQSDNYFAPTHLNYFSIKTLTKLLEICGFKVINIETPGCLDVEIIRKKVIEKKIKLKNKFLKKILIDDYEKLGVSFQKFLQKNNLSSHMRLTAQKL